MASPAEQDAPRIQPWSLWLIAAFLLGGVLVAVSYVQRNRYEAGQSRPPYLAKLEDDLAATQFDGSAVRLSELRGKLWVGQQLYHLPGPEGRGVSEQLLTVRDSFAAERDQLRFIALSIDPEEDSPESLTALRTTYGIDFPDWWLITAGPGEVSHYVRQFLRLLPTQAAPPGNPDGEPWEYDTRVVLIDGKANVRGYYQLLHPEFATQERVRLERDIRYLLEKENP